MKRILATILAFLYLSTSIGATIHLHYCMGRLISWGLINHESRHCSTCGMEKGFGLAVHKNCCKDEHKEIRTDKDQKSTLVEFQYSTLTRDAAAIYFITLPSLGVSSIAVKNPKANAPPPISEDLIFLFNCNFRI